jgi:hypothetical protein
MDSGRIRSGGPNVDSFRTVQEPQTGPSAHFGNGLIWKVSIVFSITCKQNFEEIRIPSPRWAVQLCKIRLSVSTALLA